MPTPDNPFSKFGFQVKECYPFQVIRKCLWAIVFASSIALLTLFFTFPFHRLLFGLVCVVVGAATLRSASLGLFVFLLFTLPTLQIPALSGLPYFFGPEPPMLAFIAVVSLKNLLVPRPLEFGDIPAAFLILFVTAVCASAFLVWLSLWQFPGPWPILLTLDGIRQVFFWRWGNPLNFLRVGLLFLEGPVILFCVLSTFRQRPGQTVRAIISALFILATLLMAYSAAELLIRGKTLSLHPGFGPVFMDRNAYAAFWVAIVPLGLASTAQTRGRLRMALVLFTAAAAVFCLISLSVTGVFSLIVATFLYFLLATPKPTPLLIARRFIPALVIFLLVSPAIVWLVSMSPKLQQNLQARMGERIAFWLPAVTMAEEKPFLGLGPGEFYRLLPLYRERNDDLPASAFKQENAHNYYLQLGAEIGILGVLGFLGLNISLIFGSLQGLAEGASYDFPEPRSKISTDPGTSTNPNGHSVSEQLRTIRNNFPNGRSVLAGLLAALIGLLVFSVAQHPLLRLDFQIFFWTLAAVIAGSAPQKNSRARQKFKTAALLLVLLATLGQYAFNPLTDRTNFSYGLHADPSHPGSSNFRTESLVFRRITGNARETNFQIRSWQGTGNQKVRLYVNGSWNEEELSGRKWVPVPVVGRMGHSTDLGIQVIDSLPIGFADSWGAGVLLSEAPGP